MADERSIYFHVARLLGINRRYGGSTGVATFWCLWEPELTDHFGWMEPQATDTIHKPGSIAVSKIDMLQSDKEIGTFRISITTGASKLEHIRLARRAVQKGKFQTFVYFSVRLPDVDGCGQLEPFVTRSKLPASLRVHWVPKAKTKEPEQKNLVEQETVNA